MRSREDILEDYKKVSFIYLKLELLLDIRGLLKEISDKIRDDRIK